MISNPFMLRKTHEAEKAVWQQKVDAEYQRAIRDGRKAMHQWAVELNYNLMSGGDALVGPRLLAALQSAEHYFIGSK